MTGFKEIAPARDYENSSLERKIGESPYFSRRDFLKKLLTLGAASVLETTFLGKIVEASDKFFQDQGQESHKHRGLEYSSVAAEEKLSPLERFYPDIKDLDARIVISTVAEAVKSLDPVTQGLFKVQFDNVAAFAYPGTFFPEEMAKKLGLERGSYYITYSDKEFPPEILMSTAYHESRHLKHFVEQSQKTPDDKTLYIRFPELSQEINQHIEEMATCLETIEFLNKQHQAKPGKRIVTPEEYAGIPKMLQQEKKYFMTNYINYYMERYGSNFDIPHGEWPQQDKIDQLIEKMYKDGEIIEVLGKLGE
ncbi:MAG TPA: hypothetical protein VJB39_03090 [Patescibacteria group bacterium]|nr:hypothetical protein [Patescibacteria group bacterium]